MFEQRTKFADNTFCDVSAWNLPQAFNLPFAQVDSLPKRPESATDREEFEVAFAPQGEASAYIFTNHHLGLLVRYYPGYSVIWTGSIFGLVYGALTGGVIGWAIASIYNRLAKNRPI